MTKEIIDSAMGRQPFDLLIKNVHLVNSITMEIINSFIGITDGKIAWIGNEEKGHSAKAIYDGKGCFALPGYIDGHMHLESSMMVPSHFANTVLPKGTTSVVADPHEIANVFGMLGIRELRKQVRTLPLKVTIMIPSTVPSLPNFETSGKSIEPEDISALLDEDPKAGLGEVMDFNGIAAGDERMLKIVNEAAKRDRVIDGHSSLLTGDSLQAFIDCGIDSDHTIMTSQTVVEKLRLGMYVQIQESFITPTLMETLNNLSINDRIMLVTDDVPIKRLVTKGHVDHLLRSAVKAGLNPLKAIRFVTLNPAMRMGFKDRGALTPSKCADIILVDNLTSFNAQAVFVDGKLIAKNGNMVKPISPIPFDKALFSSMHLNSVTSDIFKIKSEKVENGTATVNVIAQDGKTIRTWLDTQTVSITQGILNQEKLMKMTIIVRHGKSQKPSVGFIDGQENFIGALATTYAHDSHNLIIYSGNDEDAVIAANALIECGGGIVAVNKGEILEILPLPIAGLMGNFESSENLNKYQTLSDIATNVLHLKHREPLNFITLMALAVSPEVKLTDKGLLDVVHKKFLPLILSEKESEADSE